MIIDATFWVAIAFIIFIAGLFYLKVPQKINLLLNIANIPHNDTEVDHAPLKSFGYDWI